MARAYERPGHGADYFLLCIGVPIRLRTRFSLFGTRVTMSETSQPSASHIKSKCSSFTRSASS